MQINLYLLSRVAMGLVRLAAARGFPPHAPAQAAVFPWFGAAVWGLVLWLFEFHPQVLQASLGASMKYLYHDSGQWGTAAEFFYGALP